MGPWLASLWGAQRVGLGRAGCSKGAAVVPVPLSSPSYRGSPPTHITPTHLCALPAPFWSLRCSSSVLSALKVTGYAAPDITEDQALALLPPPCSPRDPWSDRTLQLAPRLPLLPPTSFSHSHLFQFAVLSFLAFSINWAGGEEGGGMVSWWRGGENLVWWWVRVCRSDWRLRGNQSTF